MNIMTLTPKFIGLQNFLYMFSDQRFIHSIYNSIYFMVIYATIPILLGLIVAELMVRLKVRGTPFFRVAFFMPSIITGVATGIIFHGVFVPSTGLVDQILQVLNLQSLQQLWLGDEKLVLHTLGSIGIWMTYGYMMMIFIGGLQRTDESLYEAARMDGASSTEQFFHVTLPSLRNEITVAMILNLIQGLRNMPLVYTVTKGGPGDASLVMSLYSYQTAFEQSNLGYGTTLTLVSTIFILLVSLLVMHFRKEEAN